MVPVAQFIVAAVAAYAAVGLLFAAAFVSTGVGRIDPSAEHAPIGFRLLIVPGTVALWPLLAIRWIRRQQPPTESTPHRIAATRRSPEASRTEVRS